MATVVAGCYERFLFGFDATVDVDVSTGGKGGHTRRGRSCGAKRSGRRMSAPNVDISPFPTQATATTASLSRSFYLPVHNGPVKCVAAAAPYVATGGADDSIHLFDVAVRGGEGGPSGEGGGGQRAGTTGHAAHCAAVAGRGWTGRRRARARARTKKNPTRR